MNRRAPAGINRAERPSGGRTIAVRLDPTTVDRARRGDPEAFELIVRDRIGTVYRLTLAIVGNEADATDATQDTFVAAWRQIRALRDPARLDAWLARIAVNTARMLARSRRRRAVREIAGLAFSPTQALMHSATLADASPRMAARLARLSIACPRISGRSWPSGTSRAATSPRSPRGSGSGRGP